MKLISATAACPVELSLAITEARSLGDAFQVCRPLAYHSDCSVTLSKCKVTGQQVVVKSYMCNRLSASARQQINTEVLIHSSLQHDNIVGFICAFENGSHVHLVVEYAEGGDLRKHSSRLTERRMRDFLVVPLLQALSLVHNKGYSHRDLKPDNVLVHHNAVQLADFGLALVTHIPEDSCSCSTDSTVSSLDTNECSTSEMCNAAGGTPLYAAPEVLKAMFQNKGMADAISPKNDIWALGVMCLELYTGHHPFSPDTCTACDGNVLYSIANHTKVSLPSTLSAECADWLQQVMNRDPEQRPSALDLLAHPWITKTYSSDDGKQQACGRDAVQTQAKMCFETMDSWEY